MVGGKQGILPAEHLIPSILRAVDCCRQQLAGRLGWPAHIYLKNKVQPFILESARIACNMKKGLIGALECKFGCGIYVV